MRSAYKYLAYAIDALILVQAAAIAWAVFGLGKYVEDGHTLTKTKMDADTFSFTEERGFMIHGINGQLLIPLIGLILLIISFFAKVPEGPKYAAMLFGGIVLQVVLGMTADAVPALGFIHGFWALLLFWLAYRTAQQAELAPAGTTAPEAAAVS
jgi:hypothetical protein